MKNVTLLLMYGLMHTSNATSTNPIKTTNSTATSFSTSTTTISTTRATKCCCSYKLLLLLLVLLLPFVPDFGPKVTCNTPGNSRSSNSSLTIKATTAKKGCSTIAIETRTTTAAADTVFDNVLLHLNDFNAVTASNGRNKIVEANTNICKIQLQQQHPQRLHYHDNKTSGNNIDSNITNIFAAYGTPFVVVVAYKVNSDRYNNIIFYSFCMLALLSLPEFLATFLRNEKREQQTQQQQKNCQAFFANESAIPAATTVMTTAAAAATTHLNAALVLTENAALSTAFSMLLSNKTLPLHTTLLTMKTTTTKRTAITIEKIFVILSLLQQFCTQQRKQEQQKLQQMQPQQQQYNTSNQQIMYTNCSKHCGNMYQKQQQQKQHLKLKNSAHQPHLVTIHNVLLFHKQFALFSQIVGAITAKPALAFYCIQNERIRRRRRRKRKLLQIISNSNSGCISFNFRQRTLLKQQKRSATTPAAATVPNTAAVATSTAVAAAVKKYCKCCCYTQNQSAGCKSSENSKNNANSNGSNSNSNDNNDNSSNRHNNNNNDSSLSNNKNDSNSSSSSSSNGDSNNNHCCTCCCCLCCYYYSTYHCSDCSYCCYACCCCCCCWYCCCYCCCCCCCCYYCFARLSKSSLRHCHCSICCCLCRQFKANMSNNTSANNSKTNSNNGKCSGSKVQDNNNCNSCYNNTNSSSSSSNTNSGGTSKQYSWQQQRQHYYYHQQQQHQQQQHYYKEYYQQQHKRQQQQHLFYQQHNCYHRRRRRHFCASYTSLHSCCCCFFKWICWRHQNLHNCHTVTASAKISNSNTINIFKQQSSLTSQLTQVPTATNANIKKVNATCRYCFTCNEKWHCGCCCYCNVSKTLKQQQQNSQSSFTATAVTKKAAVPKRPTTLVVTKPKEALLNLRAFRTITATAISTLTATAKTETPTSTTTTTTTTTRILPEKTRSSGHTLIASPLLSTGRMCRRFPFRCNWLWLIIGLVWLEGPKLAACNISWQVNSSNSSSNDNGGNNRSTAAALNSTMQQASYYTTTIAATTATTPTPTPTPTTTFINCSSSNCTQHTAAIFHKNVNQIPTRQKQRFQRRAIAATASTRMFEIKNGHRFQVADSTYWSELSMKAREAENRQQSDDVRLESIKSQILSRLGLKRKPNVTHPLPKQFIWDTIYRADGISSVIDFDFNDDHRRQRIISSRDGQKFVKYFATPSVHPFNEATSHKTTAMANSRVTRAYGTFFNNGGDSSDIGNGDEKKNIDNEHQHQTFVYQRMQQQQQQYLRHPREKLNPYLSYSDRDSYGSVHTDQIKSLKTSNLNNEANSEQQQRYQQHDDWEKDSYESEEFYGITQEIILFAEKGKMYKKHRLVEFSPPTHDIPSRQLQIRHAEIHIRIERTLLPMSMQQRRRRNPKLKLWIFQLVDGGDYTQRGFDQVARLCTSLNVEYHTLGWQKLDLTETVQLWYDQRTGEKLRLLIDCTGCGQHFVLHLFDVQNHTAQNEMQQQQGRNKPGARKKQHGTRSKNETEIAGKTAMEQQTFQKQHTASRNKISKNNNKNNKHHQYKQLLDHYDYKNSAVSADSPQQTAAAAMSNVAADEFYHLDDRLNPNRPFLVLHTEPKRARRVRRRVIDCAGAQHGQCCKESFYVSFKALGWDDWIIAPRGYFANYCRGDCSGPYRTPDTFQTFHAHFIEEYRKMGLLNGMQPCCAPIKFSSMSLIYYGDDGIIKRDLPKMVVDECGCP